MADFQFSFDPSIFPEPPAVPPSAELFSASEQSGLIEFLENFNDWDLTNADASSSFANISTDLPQLSQHIGHESFLGFPALAPAEVNNNPKDIASHLSHSYTHPPVPPPQTSSRSSPSKKSFTQSTSDSSPASDPSKRMNHIMSEQKRRNAIRDGYAQLTSLLAPAGAPPGTGMPTRGRPKGSGTKAGANGANGKAGGRPGAGKSGVLLRAVEYIRWLEEGRDALLEEVRRVETAAGLQVAY
ncbi:HLH transcription factor [Pyrrhoderma noxium]|uniref:HLH transcription factor n=1 Tax=Pyrrhoderma noxium TaxID=2282107 RepID=A0A286UBY6_9AGAM|nr:HLH transcription factor [Pyrrhoderma noxium]